MVAAIFCLSLILTSTWVVLPLYKHLRTKARREFLGTYRAFQLRTIRKHYPQLQEFSYRQIWNDFDVDSAYNRLQ